MKKVIIASCLSLSILGVAAAPNFANAEELSSSNKSGEITPRVSWSGTAYLVTDAYSNVTSSNNFFNDSPTVTNNAGNAGAIKVRIVNSSGKLVGTVKEIAAGKSARLDTIPWNSGTYTLQAMAVTKKGSYSIGID
ncbi:T9SS type A sorting domain-containing protein [Metabacillus fastidiosus]|uniref:T9SS type A sorting domain-containing protein n=1 Tax=Metabacillus fastidiosus TaxID=1458 RepID=UPI003D2B2115